MSIAETKVYLDRSWNSKLQTGLRDTGRGMGLMLHCSSSRAFLMLRVKTIVLPTAYKTLHDPISCSLP